MRLIIIGDIHGCAAEFEKLLDLVSPDPQDRLVLLGDLVNRGPSSHRVVALARKAGAIALLGNHEQRLLTWRQVGEAQKLKEYERRTIEDLTERDWEYLERMPLHHEEPDLGLVAVHGGFLPGAPWRTQPLAVVTTIQVVDAEGKPRRRAESPSSPHWSELWTGPPFVVYGHTPRREVQRQPDCLGLDTGCVHGGHLSALILPQNKIVQIKARQAYAPRNLI